MAAQANEPQALSEELAAARDLVRNAAKWFIAGLGAVGAVLVAGSQLSSVGALPPDSLRLYLAIAGVLLGLLAILWAMWRVVDVLAGRRWTFEDVVRDWEQSGGPNPDPRKQRRSRRVHPVAWFVRDNPSALGGFESVAAIQTTYDESDPDREGLPDLVQLMDELTDKSTTVDLQARFRRLRSQIAAGVVVGASGIILFAWAANPADPEQPPPSLTNADLTSADLSGASLRNADLTGANLIDADLRGADMQGAQLRGVRWGNTTCPDGTNSNSRNSKSSSGTLVSGTCEGHLVPLP